MNSLPFFFPRPRPLSMTRSSSESDGDDEGTSAGLANSGSLLGEIGAPDGGSEGAVAGDGVT